MFSFSAEVEIQNAMQKGFFFKAHFLHWFLTVVVLLCPLPLNLYNGTRLEN